MVDFDWTYVSIFGALIGGLGNLLGGWLGRQSQERVAQQQMDMQREFAQSGIQWRVADARAAGIHPLYALGAQTHSYSPIQVGADPLARSISDMGQNIGRAVEASASQGTRDKIMAEQLAVLQLQRGRLENDLLKTQIASNVARMRSGQIGPAMPMPGENSGVIPGQPESAIKREPEKVQPVSAFTPWMAPHAVPDVQWSRTSDGGWAPNPSKPIKELIEDNKFYEGAHAYRTMTSVLPPYPAKEGMRWQWIWDKGAYYEVPVSSRQSSWGRPPTWRDWWELYKRSNP